MPEKLRVGVVGCGAIGREHIKRITDKAAAAEVVAVTDVFEASAQKAAVLINAANVDAEVASGRHLVQVGFMRRYDKGYNQVRELLDSGDFGAPLLVKRTHRAEGVDDSYTTAMAVTDTAIHEIDVLQWLIGDTWESAQVIYPRNTVNAHEGPNAWDGYVAELTADALVAAQTSGKVEPILSDEKPAFYGE